MSSAALPPRAYALSAFAVRPKKPKKDARLSAKATWPTVDGKYSSLPPSDPAAPRPNLKVEGEGHPGSCLPRRSASPDNNIEIRGGGDGKGTRVCVVSSRL